MRQNLDLLIAWIDAVRRRDRDALRALLAPDATWEGIRPEWACSSPDEVIAHFLERADALEDLEYLTLEADPRRAALFLRAPSLAALDERLRWGVWIAFHVEDGRIARLTDHERRSRALPTVADEVSTGVDESPVADGVPQGFGWFIVNVADARWEADTKFGAYTPFEGPTRRFGEIGVNIGVLEPGQPACFYHREGNQEDFLVLQGEALLLIEGEERLVRAWDFVHCPAWTNHVFVGAGDRPCSILALGARRDGGIVYPVDEVALRHGAGVTEQVVPPRSAYEGMPEPVRVPFDPSWLPRT